MKPVHSGKGYVIVSANPVKFPAVVETIVISRKKYQVVINIGYKQIYFGPISGEKYSYNTIDGVIKIMQERSDRENVEKVINDFIIQAEELLKKIGEDRVPLQFNLFFSVGI